MGILDHFYVSLQILSFLPASYSSCPWVWTSCTQEHLTSLQGAPIDTVVEICSAPMPAHGHPEVGDNQCNTGQTSEQGETEALPLPLLPLPWWFQGLVIRASPGCSPLD